MADKKNDKLPESLNDIIKQSNIAVFGTDGALELEADKLKSVIRGTMKATSDKYGKKTSGNVVNYFNELNFTKAFSDALKDPNDKSKKFDGNPEKTFKKYMSEQDFGTVAGILAAESSRIVSYSNYRAIYNHIPECAQALDTFKDNIMSPDDFTKLIFDIKYENELNKDITERVEGQLRDIVEKYEMEILAEEIIEGSLLYGDQYLAVLSLENELDLMLTDPEVNDKKSLQESRIDLFDPTSYNIPVGKEDIQKSSVLTEAVQEALHIPKPKDSKDEPKLTDDMACQIIAEIANKNIKIGSKKQYLVERVSAENSKIKFDNLMDIPDIGETSDKKKKFRDDGKPMFINGSSVRLFDPSKVIALRIENTDYGCYVIENMDNMAIPNAGYLGPSSGREVLSPSNIGTNLVTTSNTKFTPSTNAFSSQGVSDAKVNLISKIFLDVIAKKVDKDFIRHNKEFKDFIFNLVKQDYILKKEIRMTYFSPSEMIIFKVPALYRKIIFFAKLYMAMLTNTLLIKMGRAHDKRVFYVDAGLDQNYEQAVSSVLQSIKTKEFKMDSIGDINTIINLSLGRFDDYYIPTVNGDKSIEIDTLAGMDAEISNEFTEYLNDKMMAGIGIPTTLIDATKDVNFARTLSAQNANFVRSIVKYQKRLTEPFTKLLRKLYENEYRYNNDGESDVLTVVDINDIKVSFPSPATLIFTNLMEQIDSVTNISEFISSTLIVPDPNGDFEQEKSVLKREIIKDLMPGLNWEKYLKMQKNMKPEITRKKIENATEIDSDSIMDPNQNPYANDDPNNFNK